MEVATAGAEGVVGHNGYGIVNIGFRGAQMEGRLREISIECMQSRHHWRPYMWWNRFSILVCHIRFSEVLGGRYMSLVTL